MVFQKLASSENSIVHEIYTVFQRSYRVEAQLIGTLNFPPLLRSKKEIKASSSYFYGVYVGSLIAGVIEVAIENSCLHIHSLTVEPHYFRQGVADTLIQGVFNLFNSPKAIVETAAVNIPAINLYKKHGFSEYKRWVPSHGIEKVALSMNRF